MQNINLVFLHHSEDIIASSNERIKVDFIPPQKYRNFLGFLKSLGLTNPTIGGGALRDEYLGIPERIKDWDILADYKDSEILKGTATEVEGKLRQQLEGLDGVSNISVEPQVNEQRKAFRINFDLNGVEIDLAVFQDKQQAFDHMPITDSPLSSISMNEYGEVTAHPLFTSHVKQKIFQPFPHVPLDNGFEKFAHLQSKIPDLTFDDTNCLKMSQSSQPHPPRHSPWQP